MFFVIQDADSILHKYYIEEINEHILKNYDTRYRRLFVGPQLFFYNDSEANVFVRVMDNLHSYGHLGQTLNMYGTFMPLSNYCLSYNLIKRTGYWDTCADAIGEDFHMCTKAMIKTQGDVLTTLIEVPANQMNIVTGQGSFSDFKARFWQGVRHTEGTATVAYFWKHFFEGKKNLKLFGLLFYFFDHTFSGLVVPWCLTGLLLHSIVDSANDHPFPVKFFVLSSIIFSEISMTLYCAYKNLCIEKMFKQEVKHKFRTMVEMKLYLVLINLVYIIPIFYVGAFRTIMNKREYVRADKKLNTDRPD